MSDKVEAVEIRTNPIERWREDGIMRDTRQDEIDILRARLSDAEASNAAKDGVIADQARRLGEIQNLEDQKFAAMKEKIRELVAHNEKIYEELRKMKEADIGHARVCPQHVKNIDPWVRESALKAAEAQVESLRKERDQAHDLEKNIQRQVQIIEGLQAELDASRTAYRNEATDHRKTLAREENLMAREVEYRKALLEIRDKWVPALRRDAREPDKTACNAGSIALLLAHGVPTHEFPAPGTGEPKPCVRCGDTGRIAIGHWSGPCDARCPARKEDQPSPSWDRP